MKLRYKFSFFLLLILSFPVLSFSQITITDNDITTLLTNSTWLTIDDTLNRTIDLGTASSSAQTFDFSGLTFSATAESAYNNYYSPAGRTLADSFPTANLEFENSSSTPLGPYTMTMTIGGYYSIETTGAYVLGVFMRQQLSPAPPPGFPFPADTSYISKWEPKDLALPLPATLGTTRTYTATSTAFDGDIETTTRTFTIDGFGTLHTPDGRTLQALRITVDQVSINVEDGDSSRERTKEINFFADDMTQLQFEVDTNYTGGSTIPLDYDYSKKTASLGIKQLSQETPTAFSLAQNFPNPFNPSTAIRFDVQTAGFATLTIYNVLGEEIATLVNRQLAVGSYEIPFVATNLPSGVYLYKLTVGSDVQTRKMILAK